MRSKEKKEEKAGKRYTILSIIYGKGVTLFVS